MKTIFAGKKTGAWAAAAIAALLLFFCLGAYPVMAAEPLKPSKKDKCPVCGMFVYKYPDWTGQIIFKDGSAAFFDGAKDLFKYYFSLERYNPGKVPGDIENIYVIEYYDMQSIDAKGAFYVIGSDVYGPMGHELIPFKTMEDAGIFKEDHNGRRVLSFEEISPEIIGELD